MVNCPHPPRLSDGFGVVRENVIALIDRAGSQVGDILAGEESAAEFQAPPRIEEPVERNQVGGDGEAAGVRRAGVEAGREFQPPLVVELVKGLTAAFQLRDAPSRSCGRRSGGADRGWFRGFATAPTWARTSAGRLRRQNPAPGESAASRATGFRRR